ncbi:MAG TPA: hypothetical protein VN952_11745, partial [Chthoniobacterales bacterium]|nr:hypothetical protein [Chthoniobacterales bacterium]
VRSVLRQRGRRSRLTQPECIPLTRIYVDPTAHVDPTARPTEPPKHSLPYRISPIPRIACGFFGLSH